MSQVILGLPGVYTSAADEVTHYETKVGGIPCFPGNLAQTTACVCNVCGNQLSLVLQAYAPLSTHQIQGTLDATERCLYVYGCTQLGCGKQAPSWRVYRNQLPGIPSISEVEESSPAAEPALKQQPPANDDFSFGDDFGEGEADFDFSALNQALDASLIVTQKPSKQQEQPRVETNEAVHGPPSVRPDEVPADTLLPEFYVLAAEEPSGKSVKGSGKGIDEHVKELLLKYQQEEEAAGENLKFALNTRASDDEDSDDDDDDDTTSMVGSASADVHASESHDGDNDNDMADDDEGGADVGCSSSSRRGASTSKGQDKGASPDDEGFLPEQYEADAVRGVVPQYLKFSNRLQRQPDQCVRYCWNGKPLWPHKVKPQPGTCSHCGASRVFELQIMAPIISMMMEAADLQDSAASSSKGGSSSSRKEDKVPYGARIASRDALTGAANWEMCTLAVFTCSKSCMPAGPDSQHDRACWLEEHAVLINESECHVPMQL